MLERLMNLAVFQSIGPLELLIVLGIVLVIFGPKRLPSLGRQLGSGMREFKDSITRKSDDDEDEDEDEDDDSGAATRSQAAAALGRPDEETATQPASDGVISEKP
jgi:sec-independent protein translocase protein TatA